jgi:hypothetical protein
MLTGHNDKNCALSEKLVYHCGSAILPAQYWLDCVHGCPCILCWIRSQQVEDNKKEGQGGCLAAWSFTTIATIESLDPNHFDSKAAHEFLSFVSEQVQSHAITLPVPVLRIPGSNCDLIIGFKYQCINVQY